MIKTKNPEILLDDFGYLYVGVCNCSGYYTEKYRNKQYMIKWRRRRYTFKVLEGNATLYGWQPLQKLEETLNELAKKNTESQS